MRKLKIEKYNGRVLEPEWFDSDSFTEIAFVKSLRDDEFTYVKIPSWLSKMIKEIADHNYRCGQQNKAKEIRQVLGSQ